MKPHHSFKGWMILLGWDCCIIWAVGTCNITWLSRIEHQTRWLVQPRRAPGINLSRQVSRSTKSGKVVPKRINQMILIKVELISTALIFLHPADRHWCRSLLTVWKCLEAWARFLQKSQFMLAVLTSCSARLRWQFVRSGHENLPQRATLTHHDSPSSSAFST